MKIEKFPVIAPDGTEYRVTITEDYDRFLDWWCYKFTVYSERKGRKWFRFKKLREYSYRASEEGARAVGNWYVDVAQSTLLQYIDEINAKRQETEGVAAALEAFRQWDGKINENQTEV